MTTTIQHFHIADNPEAGSALALLLAAAGYEVETDFHDGSVFICADAIDPEIYLDGDAPKVLVRQMQERMNDLADELELAELDSRLHNVA